MLFLIILATITYALYEIFAAKAGGRIESSLSAVIVNGLGALLPLLAFGLARAAHKTAEATQQSGIVFSILAGIAIAAFSVVFVKIFAQGGDMSYVIPIIYGGAIILSTIAGIALYKESVSPLQLAGIGVIAAGVAMVVTSKFA